VSRRPRPLRAVLVAVLATWLVVAGIAGAADRLSSSPRVRPLHPGAPFDGRYAYALTRLQLSFGPRPARSSAQRAAAARLVRLLSHGH
jgi:hypothetical protein